MSKGYSTTAVDVAKMPHFIKLRICSFTSYAYDGTLMNLCRGIHGKKQLFQAVLTIVNLQS